MTNFDDYTIFKATMEYSPLHMEKSILGLTNKIFLRSNPTTVISASDLVSPSSWDYHIVQLTNTSLTQ